jgi:hypothetical protein
MPPIHRPFFFDAATLSRTLSLMTSRSNWAKDKRTFSVSRPMLVVVLNCWMIETKETTAAVKDLDELGKIGERPGQPVDLVNDNDIDLACLDIGDEPFEGRPLHRAPGISAVIIERWQHRPAFVLLGENEGGAGLALAEMT